MTRILGVVCVLAGLGLGMPAATFGQDKKKPQSKSEPTPGTTKEYQQLSQLKEVVGKLVQVDATANTLTLRLDFHRLEQNPDYKPAKNNQVTQQLQSLNRELTQAQTIRNALRRQQKMQQIAQRVQRLQQQLTTSTGNSKNLPYKVVSDSKDFELEMTDKFVVRRLNPPFAYDDKGFPVEYSKEKLLEMKGKDKDKPGYEAKVEDLASGQIVAVVLKPPVKKTSSANDPKDNAKDPKEKDAKDPKAKEDNAAPPPDMPRPGVSMIVILRDAADPLTKTDQPKKKKKDK